MSGEPKTLTLRELLNLAREHEWSVHFQEGGCVEVEGVAGEDLAYARGLHAALSDAATTVLGVPVVARDEAAELRAALRTLVTDLEALAEESHLQLYDGDGALVDTSWGKVLEGGKDEYLSNWNEAKRLAGGESER